MLRRSWSFPLALLLTLPLTLFTSGKAFAHRLEAECHVKGGGRVQVEAWFETGDYTQAERACDEAVAASGNTDASYVYHRGVMRLLLGRVGEGIADLRRAGNMNASAWKFVISAATPHGKTDASKCEIGPIADLPAARFAQKTSLPIPFGATTPRPVITTSRRLFIAAELS